jgi:ABC-type multidrug transport system permease subunit
MVVGAFLFSIGGDWFLSNRHGELGIFIAGIALFFFAHVGYLLFALLNGKLNRTFTIVLQVCYLSFFFLKLFPAIEDKNLMIAVFIYLLISCFSLGAAAGIRTNPIVKWAYFFGIVMVLFSDTIIAFKEFAAYNVLNYLILPTYYLAQISITFALMRNSLSKGTNYNTTI